MTAFDSSGCNTMEGLWCILCDVVAAISQHAHHTNLEKLPNDKWKKSPASASCSSREVLLRLQEGVLGCISQRQRSIRIYIYPGL